MDTDHRELERQTAHGDVEAEVKLLLERVRAGDLSEEKLHLAAFLGHEPAILACGEELGHADDGEFVSWPLKGAPYSRALCTELAVKTGWALLPVLQGRKFEGRCKSSLEAVESWLEAPSAERAGRARHLADRCRLDFNREDPKLASAAAGVFWSGQVPAREYFNLAMAELAVAAQEAGLAVRVLWQEWALS